MATLMQVVDGIKAIAPTISRQALSGALHAPEPSALALQCFTNAERKACEAGGGVLCGWQFQFREAASIADGYYLLAVHHGVWLAPDKKLIDVTPFNADPRQHPVVVNGNVVLFLIDEDATPLKTDQVGLALPSWHFPLNDDPALAAYVAECVLQELDDWEKQVEGTEGLKGSQRAADLLRSRRALLGR